jgi:hypothetical protein
MRTEEIRDTPNSTVSPGCNSSATMLLKVSSHDAPVGGVSEANEEEDGMATYRRQRRAVCLMRVRSPMSKSKEGRRANDGFKRRLGFRGAQKEYLTCTAPPPFLYIGRDTSGNPQSNSTTSVNGHIKNPRGTISSEGSVSTI